MARLSRFNPQSSYRLSLADLTRSRGFRPCWMRLLTILLAACWAISPLPAEQEPAADFIRFVDKETKGQLQVGVGTYRQDDVTVELVGAVHIADDAYYDALNERFKGYDALLFELVGDPKDLFKTEGEEQPHFIRMLQSMMTNLLKLEHQLDGIDYKAPNFVHADLTMEAFMKLQKERGETLFTLIQRAMREELAAQEAGKPRMQVGFGQLFRALTSGDTASGLKLLVAEQFDQAEALIDASEEGGGTVLVTERNKQVIKILTEQLEEGDKKIGVFFGAGHLPDLERRVLELGFEKSAQEWLTAWDIPKPEPKKRKTATP